ncbi:MAG: hypothetical protein KTR15_05560 [Phycisphaeraceae bacterium]|nr:hypothetical protein [Phycisphaeraceae bacterium]
MMEEPSCSVLSKRDLDYIAQSLKRLRDHFSVWAGYLGREYELIGFAQYEGSRKSPACCRVVEEVVPFALGQHLVDHYGFEWVALRRAIDTRVYGVRHANLQEPIDVMSLEDGSWCEEPPPDGEPHEPGEQTYYSLEPIVRASKQKIRTY